MNSNNIVADEFQTMLEDLKKTEAVLRKPDPTGLRDDRMNAASISSVQEAIRNLQLAIEIIDRKQSR